MSSGLLRFEAWTRPEAAGPFTRISPIKGVIDYELQEPFGLGRGTIVLPEGHLMVDELLYVDPANHANDKATMIRAFNGETPVFAFYPSRSERAYTDLGQRVVKFSGPSPLAALYKVGVRAYDYNVSPSVDRDWIYGEETTGFVKNGDFESSEPVISALQNGGFELGTLAGWANIAAGGDWRASDTPAIIEETEVRTGSYSAKIDPGTRHSGIRQTVSVEPGERYTITAWLKSATTGKRFTLACKVESGYILHSVGYVYNGFALTELDNVAPNAAHNGLPGGSTDGTWQSFVADITVGSSQTSMDIRIMYDHHDSSNGPVAYIDDVSITGPGKGLEPWGPIFGPTTFEVEATIVHTGSFSAKLVANNANAGIAQGAATEDKPEGTITGLTPGRTYTAGAWVYTTDAAAQFRLVVANASGGAWITSATVVPGAATWTYVTTTFLLPVGATGVQISVRYDSLGTLPVTFYVDDAGIAAGQPAATLGFIWNQLLQDAQTDHAPGRTALTWLTKTFTDTLDSGGNAWAEDLSVRLKRGQSYGRFDSFVAKWGYESDIVWNEALSRWEFDVYNPAGLGTDYSASPGPAILGARGGLIATGPLVRREPEATHATIEGDEGFWGESEDSTLKGVWGPIEVYEGTKEIIGDGSLTSRAAERITESADRTEGQKITLVGTSLVPWIDIKKGDIVQVMLGEALETKAARRIAAIVAKPGASGEPVYQLDLDSRVFGAEAAQTEGVRRLLQKASYLEDLPSQEAVETLAEDNVGVMWDIGVASSEARPEVQAMADFVCDGVDDHEEIDSAMDLVTFVNPEGLIGQRVVLSGGGYWVSCGFIVIPAGTHLMGMGRRTTMLYVDPADAGNVLQYDQLTTVSKLGIDFQPAGCL